jgi:hypothetical protein
VLFSPGTPLSSTNETDCHDITEILLKVALTTITTTHFYHVSFIIFILFLFLTKYENIPEPQIQHL